MPQLLLATRKADEHPGIAASQLDGNFERALSLLILVGREVGLEGKHCGDGLTRRNGRVGYFGRKGVYPCKEVLRVNQRLVSQLRFGRLRYGNAAGEDEKNDESDQKEKPAHS